MSVSFGLKAQNLNFLAIQSNAFREKKYISMTTGQTLSADEDRVI